MSLGHWLQPCVRKTSGTVSRDTASLFCETLGNLVETVKGNAGLVRSLTKNYPDKALRLSAGDGLRHAAAKPTGVSSGCLADRHDALSLCGSVIPSSMADWLSAATNCTACHAVSISVSAWCVHRKPLTLRLHHRQY